MGLMLMPKTQMAKPHCDWRPLIEAEMWPRSCASTAAKNNLRATEGRASSESVLFRRSPPNVAQKLGQEAAWSFVPLISFGQSSSSSEPPHLPPCGRLGVVAPLPYV
jgi:hypothetical protein